MSFDGIVIRALVHELQHLLVGGRINKIHQPQPTDLLFLVRAGGINHKLLISANLSYPRVYITDENFVNPLEPPMFTMLLRKHLEGGVIQRIAQVDLERIIHIDITKRDELEELRMIRLVIEIMGRHSNVILVDPERNMILDGLHHVTPSISSYRQVLPGRPYLTPPAQNKLNPLEVDKSTFLSALSFNEGKLEKQIVDRFLGISPLIAKEILHRAKLPTQDGLWEAFHEIMESVKYHQYFPNIVSGVKSIFSVIPITHIEGERKSFNSINECLKSYYETKAANELIRQMANDLLHILNQEKNKYVKKLEKLYETIADAEKAEKYKLWGELITAFQFQLKAGDQVAFLPNYYEEGEPTIEIPLDPAITPNENAQIYFKKYNKAKNSLNVVCVQLEKTKEEIAYLEQVIAQIEIADQKHLEEIREELAEQGYLRNRKKTNKKEKRNKESIPKPDQYLSSEGFPIYVGRNNKQNEYLTSRLARNSDTWLHTKEIPGSHVVISGEGFGEATLHEAAMLAAYFSKGRNSSSVPVDYTLIKHVRKPSGAKPGFVIYDHQKTLYVTPDEEWVRKIMRK